MRGVVMTIMKNRNVVAVYDITEAEAYVVMKILQRNEQEYARKTIIDNTESLFITNHIIEDRKNGLKYLIQEVRENAKNT